MKNRKEKSEVLVPEDPNPDGTLNKPIEWVSACGRYVVVKGPFPKGFSRTLDARSLGRAIGRPIRGPGGICGRPATTRDYYAKTLRVHILDTANEWGEVSP